MPMDCMFQILDLPQESLKRVLPKASVRAIAKLLCAYPRSVARTFLPILADSMSKPTFQFLMDEMSSSALPSFPQIRQAEFELLKLIEAERLESLAKEDVQHARAA